MVALHTGMLSILLWGDLLLLKIKDHYIAHLCFFWCILINILNFNGSLILTKTDEHFLPLMGENLRKLRKKRYPSDDQKTFAFRIGVSKGTYVKMEKGDLSVSMASYVEAADFLGVRKGFDDLFIAEVNLFEEAGL